MLQDAGLRENMSQTVTKVEGYHGFEAIIIALYTLILFMYSHEFFQKEKFVVFLHIKTKNEEGKH